MRKPGPETYLQITICQHLKRRAIRHCIWFHIPNQGERSVVTGRMLKQMGMLPGVADLFIGVQGRPPAFMEVKAKGQGPSIEQIGFEMLCRQIGYEYELVDNIDTALDVLKRWGAI